QAGGELRSLPPGEWRRVDPHGHGQGRLVAVRDWEGARIVRVGQRLADRDLVEAGHGDDLAGPRVFSGHPLEVLGDGQLGDAYPFDRAVAPAPGDGLPSHDLA